MCNGVMVNGRGYSILQLTVGRGFLKDTVCCFPYSKTLLRQLTTWPFRPYFHALKKNYTLYSVSLHLDVMKENQVETLHISFFTWIQFDPSRISYHILTLFSFDVFFRIFAPRIPTYFVNIWPICQIQNHFPFLSTLILQLQNGESFCSL